jgi:hypothetical protein
MNSFIWKWLGVLCGALALALGGCNKVNGEGVGGGDDVLALLKADEAKAGKIATSLSAETGAISCSYDACMKNLVDPNECALLQDLSSSQLAEVTGMLAPEYATQLANRSSSVGVADTSEDVMVAGYSDPVDASTPHDPNGTALFNRDRAQKKTDAQRVAQWLHELWHTILYNNRYIDDGATTQWTGFSTGYLFLDTVGACGVAYGAAKGLVGLALALPSLPAGVILPANQTTGGNELPTGGQVPLPQPPTTGGLPQIPQPPTNGGLPPIPPPTSGGLPPPPPPP